MSARKDVRYLLDFLRFPEKRNSKGVTELYSPEYTVTGLVDFTIIPVMSL